jgi:phosphoglycolate phosphatase-like HAD superfamily hydrolase
VAEIRSWLIDMDGVLVREEHPIDGAAAFVRRLRERGLPFLILTNNSIYTRRDLAARLALNEIEVGEDEIWTSALATASFLDAQRPGGSAFVIGEAGLTTALHEIGYTLAERTRMHAVFSSVWGVASVVGPLIGGVITDSISWRWVFYLNLPIGLVAALIVDRTLPEHSHASRVTVDWQGGILLFHDIKPTTAKALPGILKELKARGYQVVHLRPKAPMAPAPACSAAALRLPSR